MSKNVNTGQKTLDILFPQFDTLCFEVLKRVGIHTSKNSKFGHLWPMLAILWSFMGTLLPFGVYSGCREPMWVCGWAKYIGIPGGPRIGFQPSETDSGQIWEY